MKIKPIKHRNVCEEVFEQMKQMIITGTWKPGQRIPSENDLREIFCVSRMTVREALKQLASLGLVETRHGAGTYVKEGNPEEVLNSMMPLLFLNGQADSSLVNFMEFRKIIELETASLAALRANDSDKKHLRKIFEGMIETKNNDNANAKLDLEFHYYLAKMTKNQYLIKVMNILTDVLEQYFQQLVLTLGSKRGIYYHGLILKAIESNNSEMAKKLMEEHIENTLSSVLDTSSNKEY